MNRLIVCGAALLMALSVSATYRSMEFKVSDGTSYHVDIEGLIITTSGENLVATNAAGEKLELPLSTVLSMQFAETPSAISEVSASVNGPVTVYTTGGAAVGHFLSVQEAWNTLKSGFYLMKDNKGQTIKIVVGK